MSLNHHKLLMVIFLLLFSFIALADEQAYQLQADHSLLDDKKKVDTHEGHVQLSHGDTQIHGQRLRVYRNQHGQIKRAIIIGEPARYELHDEEKPLHVEAQTIHVTPDDERIHFTGNVQAQQGNIHYQGPELDYYRKKRLIYAKQQHHHQPIFTVLTT